MLRSVTTIDPENFEVLHASVADVSNHWQGDTIYAEVPADGATDVVPTLKAIIDNMPNGSRLKLPSGPVYFGSHSADASDAWGLAGHSDPNAPGGVCLPLFGRKGILIDLTGTEIIRGPATNGHGIMLYNSQGCRVIGGATDGAAVSGGGEPSGVLVLRCHDVEVSHEANNLYRNLFVYRSQRSGLRGCKASGADYFGAYLSGGLDTPMSGVTTIDGPSLYAEDSEFSGATYANAYGVGARFTRCASRDAGRQGVDSQHFRFDAGTNAMEDCDISETANLNSGKAVDGVLCASASNYAAVGAYPSLTVTGTKIRGVRDAIKGTGVDTLTAIGNDVADFYRSGFSVFSFQSSGVNYVARNIIVAKNSFGPFKAGSTAVETLYDRKACVQIEQNNLAASGGATELHGSYFRNTVNGNALGSRSVSGTWYEHRIVAPNCKIGANTISGTGVTQVLG